MSPRRAPPAQAGQDATLTVIEDTSLDRVWAAQVRKLLEFAHPWALLVAGLAVAALFRRLWGGVPLAAAGVAFCAVWLAVLLALITRHRGVIGQLHATLTPVGYGGWLVAAMLWGPGQRWVFYCWLVFGGSMCLAWNARVAVRSRAWDDLTGGGDVLSRLFAARREQAGFAGAILRVLAGEDGEDEAKPKRRLPFRMTLRPGDTQKQAVGKADAFESAHHLPPGAVSLAPNQDRADQVDGVLSDPRRIRQFVMWPGPSAPGASVAEPLRAGTWQDGVDFALKWFKFHLQIMGMTGAGKSTLAAWSLLGELITRADVAVFAADVTKGDQTLGPLRPALHAFADGKAKARALLDWLHAQIRERTDALAAQGLQSWRPGATYPGDGEPMPLYVVWTEEFPRIFAALSDAGQDRWLTSILAARSAGILWVVSLQRADWTQMPTLARGQLAKCCMGVESGADADFGLTEVQQDRKARPELWGANYPGMAYLDALGVEDARRAMPLRFYSWGEDDKRIAAHAAEWPASARPLPAAAAASLAAAMDAAGRDRARPVTGADEDSDGDRIAEEAMDEIAGYGDDDDEEAKHMPVHPDEPIDVPENLADHELAGTRREEASAEEAMAMLEGQIAEWRHAGRARFDAPELLDVADRAGKSRAWLYWALDKVSAAGLIERADETVSAWDILPLTGAEGRGGGESQVNGHVSAADRPAGTAADTDTDTRNGHAGGPLTSADTGGADAR